MLLLADSCALNEPSQHLKLSKSISVSDSLIETPAPVAIQS